MHLADHIRPLLRDHDCVIIPDFGGLVADASSARAQPGRQALSPPTKLVAFNQALTRNDGLLVDALSQHLGMPISQAREAVRAAVVSLKRELDETSRTELPGIGIFRRAAGRGLVFEYTGTDNLLASAFGLPELVARPVRAANARPKHPQPILRGEGARRSRLARLLPGGIIAITATLLILANYQFLQNRGLVSAQWQAQLPKVEWGQRAATPASAISEPQLATLGQHNFGGDNAQATEGMTPVETAPATAATSVATPVTTLPEVPASNTPAAVTPANATPAPAEAVAATKPEAPATAEPTKVAATPAVAETPTATATASPTAKVPAAPVSTTIKYRTGRYYVIAGAYGTLANAEKGRKVLARTGHKTRIILPYPGSRLFRLTAADYPDLASAQREAQRLRISTRCDYNTLKF